MKYIPILIVLSIVVVGFAYYTLFAGPNRDILEQVSQPDAKSIEEGDTANSQTFEARSGVGSLEEMRGWGENIECTIVYKPSEQEAAVEGTYFVSRGNMRGDFLTQSPDMEGQVLSSMIINGSEVYIWSEIDGGSYGIKMDTSMMDQSEVPTNEPVDLDAAVDYDCKPWKEVDYTVFTPPGNVLFQDMNDIIKTGMEYGTVYEE